MSPYARMLATSAVLALVASGGCSDTEEDPALRTPDRVTYVTSFGQFGRDAYVHVAKVKGFFAAQGIEVDVKPGTGTDGVKLVAAGSADFAAVDFSGGLLQIAAADLDVQAVALIQQKSLAAIFALEGSGITTPKDLEGMTIGDVPASVVKMLFPTYAKLAGVDATKVRFINSTPQQLIALLGTGTADAISQFVVGKPTVEAVAHEPAVVLPFSDYLTDLPGNALWVSGTLAKNNPDLVKRFCTALLQGLTYSLDNPDEAGRILKAIVPATNAETAAAELQLMKPYVGGQPVGAVDEKRIARAIAILQGAGAVPPGFTPERLVAFDLVPAGSQR